MNPKIYLFTGRTGKHEGWFKVWISEDGFFNAQSDWGDYKYYWDGPGGDILSFVAQCGDDYLLDKFSYRVKPWFDEEATLKNCQEWLTKTDIYQMSSVEEKAVLLDELEEGIWSDINLPTLFADLGYDSGVIWDYDLEAWTKISGQLRQFVAKVMPMVRSAIAGFLNHAERVDTKIQPAKLTVYFPENAETLERKPRVWK